MKTGQIITVFGATGFIGAEIVRHLAHQGYILRLPCLYPKRAESLKFNGQVGQIVPMYCDFTEESLRNVVNGSVAVVNATGILTEKGKRKFMGTHHDLPAAIAQACRREYVSQFVHLSALGAAEAKSAYGKSKSFGEKTVQKIFPNAAILRPSIVFGPKDSFFNRFASMAVLSPVLPLIGGGHTLFEPVYVGDVARAVGVVIAKGQTGVFELGGPEQLSFKQLMQKMLSVTHQKAKLVTMPFFVARVIAFFTAILPNPPITSDQVIGLKTNSITDNNALKLSNLGITPTSMDSVLPHYLERYR